MRYKLLLCLFLFVTVTYADNESIVIKQKSGNETILALSTNPVITFEGENMMITNSFTSIFIPIADIDAYTVKSSTSSIQEISNDVQYQDGHVILYQVAKTTCASVYTIEGRLVDRLLPDDVGKVDIKLSLLPKGIYIISIPNQTIKVVNK